jgi:hypothetical protein
VKYVSQNCVAEWSYTSGQAYDDPFSQVTLDVSFVDPEGHERVVPAFWAGERTWCVRYASPIVGTHRYRTRCSDAGNADLHNREGILEVTPYQGSNPLLQRGRLRVAAGRRHLEHQDRTPFLWLADTWWMGFCRRLQWPSGFQELAADRVRKGFTVVQIVAGLYPDMEPFDERGANEAGFPWEPDFSRIRPAYFDMADLRIAHLVRSGIVPCIVGSWGYFLDFAGVPVLQQHWRNLIARYGAYPVVWCTAGEALMEYYLGRQQGENAEARRVRLRASWSEMVRYIRDSDPFHNPVTIHPTRYGHDQVSDPALLDVDMLQTGHSGYPTLAATVDILEEALAHEPRLPVLVSEANYEGIQGSSGEEMQRFLFWSSMLSGAMGHTYGANGLWQVNSREKPYGPSPHGTSWGDTPWEEAYQLPGSAQLGLGKRLLERHPWQAFEPHPEWVEPHQGPQNRMSVYAAGVPGQVRFLFIPAQASWVAWGGRLVVRQLEEGASYHGFYFNPRDGQAHDLGTVTGNEQDEYVLPKPPVFQDWVVVLERQP